MGKLKADTYNATYTFLEVTFKRSWFSLQEAACAQLSCGYAALDALERQSAHLQFQQPQTKL